MALVENGGNKPLKKASAKQAPDPYEDAAGTDPLGLFSSSRRRAVPLLSHALRAALACAEGGPNTVKAARGPLRQDRRRSDWLRLKLKIRKCLSSRRRLEGKGERCAQDTGARDLLPLREGCEEEGCGVPALLALQACLLLRG